MASSPCLVTRGIVLRETETKESDKILTLLTEDRGKTPVIARRARRKSCKYAACAQILAFSEWTLYQKGEWYYANEGASIELFTPLRGDFTALSLGCYFAELAEAAAMEEVPMPELLRHLLNGLYALSALHKAPELVKPAFELKYLSLAGFAPLADACAYCGSPDPAEPCLDTAQGTLHCRSCGSVRHSVPLCRDSLSALRHVLYGDPRRLYAFRLGGSPLERLSQASETFLLSQLDRKFRTLDYYKSLAELEPGREDPNHKTRSDPL